MVTETDYISVASKKVRYFNDLFDHFLGMVNMRYRLLPSHTKALVKLILLKMMLSGIS